MFDLFAMIRSLKRRWTRPASEQGVATEQSVATVQCLLGISYRTGRGVPQDDAAAARLFRLAAERGNAIAQFNLGVMCGKGERSGPRNLDSGLSEISIVFQAAVPKLVASKYTTSGVRRPSEL